MNSLINQTKLYWKIFNLNELSTFNLTELSMDNF